MVKCFLVFLVTEIYCESVLTINTMESYSGVRGMNCKEAIVQGYHIHGDELAVILEAKKIVEINFDLLK